MHSNPHRTNSDFQLRSFLAGSCHTADTAWCLLYEQKVDVTSKLAYAKANVLRRQARKLELEEKRAKAVTEIEKLRVEADFIEFEAQDLSDICVAGSQEELDTINALMEELEPYRKYGHLSVTQAAQAAQEEEWLLEFKHRIENYVLTQGMVPEDQLAAMRKHPQFATELIPHIKDVVHALAHTNGTDGLNLISNKTMTLIEYKDSDNATTDDE